MSSLIDHTLKRIAQERIQPIPQWAVWLANFCYWVGSFVLVVLSALATMVSIHVILEIDWDAYIAAGFSLPRMILSGVPLFSLTLFALFLWLSILLLHATKRGYRYPISILAGLFFAISVLSGYFFESSPFDEPVERAMSAAFPHSEKFPNLLPSADRQWSQPERGLLGGVIWSSSSSSMQIKDRGGKIWQVWYSQAIISTRVTFEEGEAVKVIGKKRGEKSFEAEEIRIWEEESLSE